MRKSRDFVFSSESVSAGHPDKICDRISDAVLDALIRAAPGDPARVRAAVETLATPGRIVLAGEYRGPAVDFEGVCCSVVADLGYNRPEYGFDAEGCRVDCFLHGQSGEIAAMVDAGGAGDQGLMFGYANRDTAALMPMPVFAAHRLIERIDGLRRERVVPWLRPDGKCQFSIRYAAGRPTAVERLVVAVPHDPGVSRTDLVDALIPLAVLPLAEGLGLEFRPDPSPAGNLIVNGGTGDWTRPGPAADSGLTGRKIVVDTYGGWARHGGGAFSGKDPTKVDRSAAYWARYAARNVVEAGLAEECEIQIAYAIGLADPVSLRVDTAGTGVVPDRRLEAALREVFSFRPGDMIRDLGLFRPIYERASAYGHFGREPEAFPWERTDRIDDLRKATGVG